MEIIIIGLLALIIVEVSYLVAVNTNKLLNRKTGRPVFVDTSVLIDGRIIAVAQSGFIDSDTLFIPRSVIGELQYLADNGDADKRTRARHGLDIVTELQAMTNVTATIFQDGSKAEEGVDERLLKLAKKHRGAICTIDYNLNKVAQVENIDVLNVNDLAMSLRMAYLPGEKMMLDLTQTGQDSHQAVGHLTDGTMVVVERASQLIGRSVEIEFIRSLQTAAGKMMFAKLVEKPQKQTGKFIAKGKPADRSAKQFVEPNVAAITVPSIPYVDSTAVPAFHSDHNDQRLAKRNQGLNKSYSTNKKSSKKFRTSAQSEADLINILNSQD